MTERVIDISDEPARLCVRDGCLVIERGEGDWQGAIRVPLKDIACVILTEKRTSVTQSVLSSLAEAGGALIACDSKCMPVGMMLPLNGHTTQGERFVAQAAATLPTRKRLWQEIVREKVKAQGRLLARIRGSDRGLLALSSRVRSGDPDNVEGQAARRYWTMLFEDPAFVRDRDRPGRNALLNYGYAVLRATVARAVCASGLHPSLGLHHHNRYDSFCLVDDLMEPFRPVVDGAVVGVVEGRAFDVEADAVELDRETKRVLLGVLASRQESRGEARSLFDLARRAASSLVKVFTGEARRLDLPEI